MQLIINNNIYTFSDEELNYRYIDEGEEATIYYYNNKALKIYKDYCRGIRLSEKDAIYLQKINTERFLLPIDIIYDINNNFIGYTTKFIKGYSKENIKILQLEFLKRELLILKKDIEELSKYNISIFDIENYNFILGDGIYLIDPGSYRIEDNNTLDYNIRYLRSFIINEILLLSRRLTIRERELINKNFNFEDLLNSEEKTISLYSKKLAK